ncbi:MAG: helix-turn-helix domain-containing protein, partial [Sedimentisphaerales bacterium]
MAGMFYSIKEVAEKLGKSEDEVRQIVKSGRLREFRDGSNLLFKVDEVNSLLSDTSFMAVNKPSDTPAPTKSEEVGADEV